jgi:ribonuclease J
LRDRQHLATDGLILVMLAMDPDSTTVFSGPDIITRGFALNKEAEGMVEELRKMAVEIVDNCIDNQYTDWATIKQTLRSQISGHLFRKTKRKPMIVPVIMEV